MITVYIGNNARTEKDIVDVNMTLRACFEKNGVSYADGVNSLDGATLAPGDLDKTFAEMGITEKCYLTNTKKLNNAA